MNITPSAPELYKPELQDDVRQRRQEIKAVENALKAGDLAAAQQAFEVLQKDKLSTVQAGDKGAKSEDERPARKDLKALGDAIQGGKLPEAQAALDQFKQDIRIARPPAGGGSEARPAREPAKASEQVIEKAVAADRAIAAVADPSLPGKPVGVILNKLA